jgi:hypothetical protein
MEDNKNLNIDKIDGKKDEENTTTPKPDDKKADTRVPLHTHIEMRKEKNQYKEQSQSKDEYVALVEKLQKLSGKSKEEIAKELEELENKGNDTPNKSKGNDKPAAKDDAVSDLANRINDLTNENKFIRMSSDFDKQVKSEGFRSAREHREKILKFAIEKDLPLENAIWAVCGDTIAADKAKLDLSKEENGNNSVDINTTNGGGYNIGGENKGQSAKLAEGIKMGVAEYDLFKENDPQKIHDYYQKQRSK